MKMKTNATSDDNSKKISELENLIKTKEDKINELEEKNRKSSSAIIIEQQKNKIKINTLENQVSTLTDDLTQLQSEIDEKNTKIEELEIKIKKGEIEKEKLEKKLNDTLLENKKNNETLRDESNNKINYLLKEKEDLQNKITEMTSELDNLKDKINEMENEKSKLKNEINSLQEAINTRAEQDIYKQEQLEFLLTKGYDEKDGLDELRKKNLNLRLQLKENQDTLNRAQQCIKKAEYFDNCVNYGKILIKNFQPNNNEELESFNKLKSMLVEGSNNTRDYSGFDKNDFNFEGTEKKKKGLFGFFNK
jgi:chromosome segregation ATPase